MNNKKPNPIFIVVIAVSFLLLVGGVLFFMTRLQQPPQAKIDTLVNKAVPSFTLPNLDNSKQLTNADLPKKPYLLNVWATWCIACSKEHPILIKLQKQGETIVGINYKDDAEYASKYLQEDGNPYLVNLQDEEGNFGVELGVTGAPETYVVDSQGIIRQHITGEITQEKWQNRIEPCLSALKNDKNLTDDKLKAVCQ
ncbi:MAG: DsbE family thiol:disulfide interchange protein [Moraxellaceae bacterium]|nr:DsbE family thiol:disulfide interchange protein [Moraxellaceae bacterium]